MLYELYYVCLYFFFFQAEDGIRDTSVTGVQTCALPIWQEHHPGRRCRRRPDDQGRQSDHRRADDRGGGRGVAVRLQGRRRSEERRVGKEGRAGGWREH